MVKGGSAMKSMLWFCDYYYYVNWYQDTALMNQAAIYIDNIMIRNEITVKLLKSGQ